ncbi:hypothetical protein [Leptolyngbya sp. 'hensonii']|uniref:photosystem II assembly protein Psb35 n=1 Tax=Leptolyngbya sp. 'hensonii' TaxID=1922337 RepID=UPI0034184820
MSKLVAAADQAPHFPVAFTLVYGVGFVAAVGIGSIAWYNSKRPAGWEDKGRPDFVPEVKTEESSDPE